MLGERLDSWLRGNVPLVDGLLAGVLVLVLGVYPFLALSSNLPALGLSVLMLGPLAWRRLRPVACLGVVAPAAALQWGLGIWTLLTGAGLAVTAIPADVAVLLVVYSVTAYASWRASAVALALALVGAAMESWLLYATVRNGLVDLGRLFLVGAVAVVAAWSLGALRRTRGANLEALRERARLLEVERDQQTQLAASAERARIARELHDVVAHSLAVVIAQADGGRYASRESPDAARAALATIGDTGRRALAEMRQLLGVLRTEPAEPVVAPQPDVAAIPALVDQLRAGGLPVELSVEGMPQPLPHGIELAIYRIVQQSLTNVLQHAGTATARVRLVWSPSSIEVVVSDDGRGVAAAPPGPGGGQGLIGMRERAALYGGRVEASPAAEGGFVVRAVLPMVDA